MMTNLGPDLGQLARALAEAVGIGIIAYLIYERRRLRSRIRQERKRKEMEKKIEEEAFKEEVETDDLDSPEVVETAAAAVAAAYETKNSIRKSLSDVGFSQGQESIWSFGSNNCWERTQEEKGRECGEEEEKEEQAKKKNFTSVDEGESRSSRNDDELKEEGGIVAETFEDNNTMEEEEVAKEKNPDPSSGCNKTSSDEVVMNEEPPVFVVLSEPLDEVDDVGKETGQVKQKDEQVAKETNESRIESCSDDIDTNEANTANEHESIKEEAVEIISDVFKNALDLVEAIALQTEKAGGGSKGDLSNKSVKEETVIAQSDVTADSTIPNGDASTDTVTKKADDLEHGGVIEIDSNREIEEEICCAKLSNSPAEFSQKRSGQEISAEEENAPATSNKSELTTNSSEHVLTEENRDEKSNLESDALQVPPEIQHQPVPQLQDQEPPLGSPKPMPRRRKSRSTITDTRIDSGDRDASAPKEENANATKEDREEEEEKKKQIDAASAALGERIGQLQDALAASESAIADGRLEVVKERSRTSLLKQEMKVQEEICQMKMEQAYEEVKEAQTDLSRFHREADLHRETFQKTLRALKSSLDEKEEQLKEKEESNYLLRKDLLDLMTQFNTEKSHLERRLSEHRDRIEDLTSNLGQKNELIAQLQEGKSETKKKLEKKSKDKRRLMGEVTRLQLELEKALRVNARGIKVTRMLEHIENID